MVAFVSNIFTIRTILYCMTFVYMFKYFDIYTYFFCLLLILHSFDAATIKFPHGNNLSFFLSYLFIYQRFCRIIIIMGCLRYQIVCFFYTLLYNQYVICAQMYILTAQVSIKVHVQVILCTKLYGTGQFFILHLTVE